MVGSQGPRRMVDAEPQGLGLVLQDIATSSGMSARVNSLPTVEPVDRLGDLQEARGSSGHSLRGGDKDLIPAWETLRC